MLALVAWGALAACGEGAGCGSSPEEEATESSRPARTADDVTELLARALPESVEAVLMIRNWDVALERYEAARPQLEAITGDVGFVEADLRNTLGVDLREPSTLSEAGIAADGGAAVTAIGEVPVTLVLTSDAPALDARMRSILPEQPFRLGAEPEVRTVSGATLTLFRRESGARPEAALAQIGDVAAIFRAADVEALEAATAALAGASEGSSLADGERFARAASQAGEHDLLLWLSGERAASGGRVPARIADDIEVIDADAAAAALRRFGDAAFYLTLDASGIRGSFAVHPATEIVDQTRALVEGGGSPAFAALVDDSAFAVVRGTLTPAGLVSVLSGWREGELREAADEHIEAFDEIVGMSVEDELAPALGGNFLALLTRQRLMTLSRAMNSGAPGEWFSGLGAVVAVEVRDRDTVARALEAMVPNLDGRATTFEDDGTLVLEFTDAQADIGNLVLTDDALLLVPSRQRRELVDRASAEGLPEGSGAAFDLARAPRANGLFVDMQQIVEGPLGRVGLARLPEEAQRALARCENIVVSFDVEETRFVGSLEIAFAPLGE